MKWGVLIILVLLMSVLTVSATTEKIDLKVGESFTIRGRNVMVLALNEEDDKVVVCVNNQKAIISEEGRVGEVRIKILNIVEDGFNPEDSYARLELENDCRDCVCNGDCDNSQCIIEREECSSDNDCDDNDEGTSDKCEGNPKKCVYRDIEVILEDVDACSIDIQCDDENECTADTCQGEPKVCHNLGIEGCGAEIVEEVSEPFDFVGNSQKLGMLLAGVVVLLLIIWIVVRRIKG